MRKFAPALPMFLLTSILTFAQRGQKQEPVEIELMTHTEIYSAIHNHGKTTVLVYNGGNEQRGPHAVLGGHNFIARAVAEDCLPAPMAAFATHPKWCTSSRHLSNGSAGYTKRLAEIQFCLPVSNPTRTFLA